MSRRMVDFRWDVEPSSKLGRELQRRGAVLRQALELVASTHAARAEAEMKRDASWNDRTAFARASLFGRADGLTIFLGTTNEEYGRFLEFGTSRMKAYPVIGPQLRKTSVEYFEDASMMAGGILIGGSR